MARTEQTRESSDGLHAQPSRAPVPARGVPLSVHVALPTLLIALPPIVAAMYFNGSAFYELLDLYLARTFGAQGFGPVTPGHAAFFAASMLWVLAGAAIASRGLAHPLRAAAAWVREAREHAFEQVRALPHASVREMHALVREIGAAMSYFSESEKNHAYLLKQKDEFLTIAAHQLRTPLTGLEWGFMSLRNPALSPEERQGVEQSVQESLARMLKVVNGLLQTANIGEGRSGFVFEKSDIAVIVKEVIDEHRASAAKKNITLALDQPEALPAVRADVERISFVISTLVSNAVDYTGQDGRVTVSVRRAKEGVEIAVEDSGIGISEKDLLQIPLKFYRGETARSMNPNGSGIGLYTARNIVERHGATLAISSKEGVGSRFSFILPYAA